MENTCKKGLSQVIRSQLNKEQVENRKKKLVASEIKIGVKQINCVTLHPC